MNVDLFEREGVPLPAWDWTWDDLLRAAVRLTKRDASGQASQLGLGRPGWLYWIWSAGGDLYSGDGKRMLIAEPPALQALSWLQEAVHKHRVCPNPQEQGDPSISEFVNGRIAMVFGARGSLGSYRSIENFTFDAAPIPKGPKARVSQLGVGYTSIWSKSKAPDEAFTVLNFICSAEGQRLKISRGYAHPSRKSLTEQAWYRDYKAPRSRSNQINTVFPEMLKRGEARAATPHAREAEIFQIVNRHLGDLWSNARPPRDVAQAIVAETSSLMA